MNRFPKNQKIPSQRGMTLIEVLVALVIFAVVLLAMVGFMDVIQGNNQYNRQFSAASFLAQAKMEELLNRNFTALILATPVAGGVWTPHPPEIITATGMVSANGQFNWQWRIIPDLPAAGMKQVEVTTNWTDRKQKNHQITFKSAKAP